MDNCTLPGKCNFHVFVSHSRSPWTTFYDYSKNCAIFKKRLDSYLQIGKWNWKWLKIQPAKWKMENGNFVNHSAFLSMSMSIFTLQTSPMGRSSNSWCLAFCWGIFGHNFRTNERLRWIEGDGWAETGDRMARLLSFKTCLFSLQKK